MMHRPWPGPAAYDAAPVNPPAVPATVDWSSPVMQFSDAVEFPDVTHLFRIALAIEDAKRGER